MWLGLGLKTNVLRFKSILIWMVWFIISHDRIFDISYAFSCATKMNTCKAPNAVNVCIKIVTDNKLRESLQLVSMVHLSASGKRRNLLLKYLGLHESLLSCSLTKAFLTNRCYNHNILYICLFTHFVHKSLKPFNSDLKSKVNNLFNMNGAYLRQGPTAPFNWIKPNMK